MTDYPLLTSLNGSASIRFLSYEEKRKLAEELRAFIIQTVAANGGHLAPNLGVIELTIALLATNDVPRDSVIFDVGHQCYAWKILTDRFTEFPTLRQKGGLSGFPKTTESAYDVFNTGHSSTSISAAVGLARAKSMKGDQSKTIALIGDGALGGGMAFEALSDAGQAGDNLLVILNDNQMCIDHAVGGVARHLEQLRTSQRYIKLKTIWEQRLERVPLVGDPSIRLLARLKRRWRLWRREGGAIFEQLGFRYYGPVDGHNLEDLERHLKALRMVRGPVLFHVITVKGKGYPYAEDEPEFYHGVSPFDTANGRSAAPGSGKTFSSILGETIIELAELDPNIVAITAAMAQGTGLIPFRSCFPNRFMDVGIAEQHAVTMAAGMAVGGLRPVVTMYSTFLQRAVDQMLHDVCLQNLPVVFAVDRAGLVGGDGDTHQGVYDLAIALSLPNLTVTAPATASDLRALLHFARRHDGPVLIRYPHDIAAEQDLFDTGFDLNRSSLADIAALRPVQKGDDLTVIVLGAMLEDATRAVDHLIARFPGRSVDLFSCIVALPFDYENMLISIQRTGKLFVIEDGVEQGGFGSIVVSEAQKRYPGIIVDFAGVTKPTADQASRAELKADEALDAPGLEEQMLRLMGVVE